MIYAHFICSAQNKSTRTINSSAAPFTVQRQINISILKLTNITRICVYFIKLTSNPCELMALFMIDSLLTTYHRMQHLNYKQCNLFQMNLLMAITCMIITTLENVLVIEQNSQ